MTLLLALLIALAFVLALALDIGLLKLRFAAAYRRHRWLRRLFLKIGLPTLWLYQLRPVGGGAGEMTIKDWTAQNKLNANLQPYTCLDIDVANSNAIDTAVQICGAALAECIGVCYDKARLDPVGAVIKGSGVTVRTYGFARIIASAAIAAGAYVSVANAAGQIQAQAQAIAGAQPKAIVGRALTSAAALNDRPVIALMIGARY